MSNITTRIEALNKENFDTWKLQVEALLVKNDTWEYVIGEKVKPKARDDDGASLQVLKDWEIADRKAKSDLILSISPAELKQVKGCSTSNEVWRKLHSVYQSSGPARKATLLKRLILHKMEEGEDVRNHIAAFFDAVDKLQDMEIMINEDLLAIMLLYSLPESYENFRCAIESRDDLPKPEALKVKIFEEYDARKSRDMNHTQNAMLIRKRNKYAEKRKEEIKPNDRKSKSTFKLKCFRCRKLGHKASECKASEPYHASKLQNETSMACDEAGTEEYNEFALLHNMSKNNEKWCLDSGCTSHMTADSRNFHNLQNAERILSLANGESTKIRGMGEVKLSASNGEGTQVLKLNRVMHVPDLRTNLLSVSKITDRGFVIKFEKEIARIVRPNGEVVAVADRKGDLYYLRKSGECVNIADVSKPDPVPDNWHQRLGHVNEKSLVEMARKRTVLGLNLPINQKLPTCEVCIQAKHTQAKFPESECDRTTEVLEIVHTDVCGPIRTSSVGGSQYFAVFIDDKSRWCEVYFLKKKNDVLKAFKEYKAYAETHTGKKIKCLQSDNGLEFCNQEFDKVLSESGIRRRLTVPYTPQQNGVAERKNRTLVETARCMMIQAKTPASFWAEAVHTANYVKNRCASKSLNGETPYKLWMGKRPTVSHFRVFGSKAYVLNKKSNKSKFEARSTECMFVGYSTQSKAYRLWHPSERRVIVSRDVRFIDKFSFNTCSDDEDSLCDLVKKQTGDNESVKQVENENYGIEVNLELHKEEGGERTQTGSINIHQGDDNGELAVSRARAECVEKRTRGRPKFIRTGGKGRPKKKYCSRKVPKQAESSCDSEYESAQVAQVPNPENLEEALSGPNAKIWRTEIKQEYLAIIKNKTWKIVDRPENKNIIGSKFVLQTKYNADGGVQRRKARLVARGFAQQKGIDYQETFAPVARASSIRMVMAVAVERGLIVHQMDVTTAYLNGDVEEQIYMELPELLEETLLEIVRCQEFTDDIIQTSLEWLRQIKGGKEKACLLQKSLYGLKQSGRQWYKKLAIELEKIGLKPVTADSCVYVSERGSDIMLVTVYVDDLLLASNSESWLNEIKTNLSMHFEMKDLGRASYCLGIEFKQSEDNKTICMSQRKYIEEILEKFGMDECKPVATPSDANIKLRKNENETNEQRRHPYQQLIGSLMYLAVMTRPDLAYVVSALSQFNTCHSQEHWIEAKRVLRYLQGTNDYGLVFHQTNKYIEGFVDADWGAAVDDRKSYTGYAFMLGGACVSWEAKKQRCVALSSTESEYVALSEATKEAIHLRRFLDGVGYPEQSLVLFNDNQGAQRLVKNPIFHNRTKHIDIRYHFIREAYEKGIVKIKYLATQEMPADILTKGLFKPKFEFCREQLGVRKINRYDESMSDPLRGSVGSGNVSVHSEAPLCCQKQNQK